jgi:hypothetical protein
LAYPTPDVPYGNSVAGPFVGAIHSAPVRRRKASRAPSSVRKKWSGSSVPTELVAFELCPYGVFELGEHEGGAACVDLLIELEQHVSRRGVDVCDRLGRDHDPAWLRTSPGSSESVGRAIWEAVGTRWTGPNDR